MGLPESGHIPPLRRTLHGSRHTQCKTPAVQKTLRVLPCHLLALGTLLPSVLWMPFSLWETPGTLDLSTPAPGNLLVPCLLFSVFFAQTFLTYLPRPIWPLILSCPQQPQLLPTFPVLCGTPTDHQQGIYLLPSFLPAAHPKDCQPSGQDFGPFVSLHLVGFHS